MSEKEIEHDSRKPQILDDEIDLIDLWLTLVRRKVLVITVFLVVVSVAALWLLTRPPVFEATAIIDTGRLSGTALACPEDTARLPDDRTIVCTDVLSALELDPDTSPKPDDPSITEAALSGTTLTITTAGASAESARDLAGRRANDVLGALETRYTQARAEIEERVDFLEGRLSRLGESSEELWNTVQEASSQDNAGAYSLALLAAVEATDLELAFGERRRELVQQLGPNSAPPELVSIDSQSVPTPAESRMTGAFSLVLALMLGVLSAFVAEFFASVRLRRVSAN